MVFFVVIQSINTGLEKLGVMDLLPDTVIVSGKGQKAKWPSTRKDTRPNVTVYDQTTGKTISSLFPAHESTPDGMAVITTAEGCRCIAFSYR